MERMLCTGEQRNGRSGKNKWEKAGVIRNKTGSGRKRFSDKYRFLSEPFLMSIS